MFCLGLGIFCGKWDWVGVGGYFGVVCNIWLMGCEVVEWSGGFDGCVVCGGW